MTYYTIKNLVDVLKKPRSNIRLRIIQLKIPMKKIRVNGKSFGGMNLSRGTYIASVVDEAGLQILKDWYER